MKQIEVVAAIIHDDQGRIFTTQRGYGEWKDWWEFPGGKIEAGETPEEAAVREVKEELGLDIKVEDLVPAWNFIAEWNPGTGLLFSVFGCRADVPEDGFDFNKREVKDVKLAPFDEFYKCMMDHNDEAFGLELKKLEARL